MTFEGHFRCYKRFRRILKVHRPNACIQCTNYHYRIQIQNYRYKKRGLCPGALTKFKTREVKMSGKDFQACSWTSVTEAPFTNFSSSATFDVVSSVGGPRDRVDDWIQRLTAVHRVSQVLWCRQKRLNQAFKSAAKNTEIQRSESGS